MSVLGHCGAAAAVVALTLATAPLPGGAAPPRPPESPHRPADQTFLTYPEWFLVFSPDEYATYVADRPPSDFPFWGHVGQFWESYAAVRDATRVGYPPNPGYHAMIVVIGASTTVEYGLKSAYETTVGRLTELSRTHGPTAEDAFAARFARDYVDFIRVRPWYEYGFAARLRALWTETPLLGPDVIRKWERRHWLTQELVSKSLYGALIGLASASAYDAPVPRTEVRLADFAPSATGESPELTVLARGADGVVLAEAPRYEGFTGAAVALARRGARFEEIAGNRGAVLVGVVAPVDWRRPAGAPYEVLFAQTVLTRPETKRVALVMPVARLADALRGFDGTSVAVEHVFDY